MPGRRWSDGLHQAVEAKEGVKVEPENVTYATITIQNYFRMYEKLAGMTGTALTEAEEFFKIYKLDVLPIPTNLEYAALQANAALMEQEQKDEHGYKVHVLRPRDDPKRKPDFLEAARFSGCGLPHRRSQDSGHHHGNHALLRHGTAAAGGHDLGGAFRAAFAAPVG